MREQDFNERKWYLAAKLLTDGLTAEEQVEWDTFKEDRQFLSEFELIRKNWDKIDTLPYEQINTPRDWEIVLAKIKHHTGARQRTLRPVYRYAAAIAVFVLVSFLMWWSGNRYAVSNTPVASATTIEAPQGARTLVTLPDSSKVWLNAGSRISFDKDFGALNRNISLEGEAFFDVIKNKVPFKVHTEIYDISVLGTAFNVRAYYDDDQSTTTLVRGSLKVNMKKPSGETNEVLLKPDEKLVIWKDPSKGVGKQEMQHEKKIDASAETAWKDGWLTVRGESLDELSKKIERLYDVDIQFSDEDLKQYRYTGRIQQFSLEQVLKALALTSPVEFTINERHVVLSENKSMSSKYRSLQTP